MDDKFNALRDTKYVLKSLTACVPTCNEVLEKYQKEYDCATDDETRKWFQKTIVGIERQMDMVLQGIDEIQIMRYVQQIMSDCELRVQKYAQELIECRRKNEFLEQELAVVREKLEKSDSLVIDHEAKNEELCFYYKLNREGNMQCNGDRQKDVIASSNSVDRKNRSTNMEAANNITDEKPSQKAPTIEYAKELSEADLVRKKMNEARTLFKAGDLKRSEEVCKEILSDSHRRLMLASRKEEFSAKCIWEVAERNQNEKKSSADYSDTDKAAILEIVDGENSQVMWTLKQLSEIYRQQGKYIACETLEDVSLRIRNNQPQPPSRRHHRKH